MFIITSQSWDMCVMKGSVEVLLYTFTHMQNRVVTDSRTHPWQNWDQTWLHHSLCFTQTKGTRTTSLYVVIGVDVPSEWENILFSHHFISVQVETLFKTSLNLLAQSILNFHLKWLIMVIWCLQHIYRNKF